MLEALVFIPIQYMCYQHVQYSTGSGELVADPRYFVQLYELKNYQCLGAAPS